MLDETYTSYSSELAAVASQSLTERDYWLKNLSGDLEKTSFPFDYDYLMAAHDQPAKAAKIGQVEIRFPAELTGKLLWISNKSDSRLLMILLTGLAVLLNKYTGNEDIIMGMPVYKQEVEGKFINTVLPLRCRVHRHITIKDLLYQVKQTIDQAIQNQNYPMKALLYELNLPYSEMDFPLFDIDVLLRNIQDKTYIQHIHSKMRFLFSREENSLGGILEYNPTFYSQKTAARIIDHYLNLLKGIFADVNVPLYQGELLSEAERKKILEDFNNTARPYLDPQGLPMEKTGTLVSLLAAQVAKTPGNTAVIDARPGTKITYRQLVADSNRLAHLLKKAGVKPGTIVAIALENPLATVTAILAVLKTGACYLPIDHDYPADRKRYMLLDSEAGMLIGEGLEEITREIPAATTIIDIPTRSAEIAAQSAEDLGTAIVPTSPAYIIYTSGTTGRPKGVVLEHRQAVNTLCYRQEAYNMTPGDVALQLFSYSFDGFITSFFTPLLSGTAVVLLSKSDIKDLFKIKDAITQYRVTHFISVPTLYRGLIVSLTSEEARYLKVVTLAGEAVTANLLEMTRDKNPNLEIANEYGVTEGAVMSTLFRHQEKAEKIKIGKAIANTQLYIVNEENHLQPIGLPGELCIAGAGVARGYLNNPELTSEKFIKSDWSGRSDRLYKTGDMARWDNDGSIQYLGRIDHQAKLRGFRIEPEEIQGRLAAHPGVKDSYVQVVENTAGDKQLAAYVVPAPERAFTVLQLLRYQQDGTLEDHEVITMPGQLPVVCVSRQEVELLHEKIFAEQAYLRHGISLDEGDCVFDVGAHIGLFSIFVKKNCPGAAIYAFEPLPPIFAVLKLNTSLYGINARLYPIGLAAAQGEESFTFYPHASGFSGRYPDKNKEMAVIGSYMLGRQESRAPGGAQKEVLSEAQMSELLEERLTKRKYSCPTISLSQFIRENDIKHIDLLKITTERSEREILTGIADHDWSRIRQMVIKVDNGDGRLEDIKKLLEHRGYQVNVDQDVELENTDLYSIYARIPQPKKDSGKAAIKVQDQTPQWHSPQDLQDDIKAFLAKKLPDFMVPQAYVLLEQIPLTPNRKVDRKRLPPPDTLIKTEEFVAPRNDIEKHLVEIWAEILDIEPGVIGIDANFFESGGHSLTATVLASRIHKDFNVKVPMTEIFKSPKIRSLAEYINTAAQESFVSIHPVEQKEYYPLSSAQGRLFVLQKMDITNTVYNIYEIHRMEGEPDLEKLKETFGKLILRHESLRTSFHMVDGTPVQRVHNPSELEFKIHCYDLAEMQIEIKSEQAVGEFIRPFDLSRAPLLRVGLITIEPLKQVIVMDMHHIISDGVSHGILIKDFLALYQGSSLPLSKLQYKDYTQWQQTPRVRDIFREQEEYWIKQFHDEIPVLNIPIDYSRPALQGFEGSEMNFVLGSQELKSLNEIAWSQGTTLFMVLLAVFNVLLAKLSGQEDIVVGSPIAARKHADLEQIIGMFVNTLALRNHPISEKTFTGFLHDVKKTSLDAFKNQDYPFEELVEKVEVRRDFSRNPLFDVMFVLQNIDTLTRPIPKGKTAGLNLKPYPIEQKTAKFDLTLTAMQRGEAMEFIWEYSTKLFKPETIKRYMNYFKKIAANVLESPNRKISTIEMISEPEKNQVLFDFNDTKAEYPQDKTIHELFTEQAKKTPDHIAIVGPSYSVGVIVGAINQSPQHQITYKKLNENTNQLAHKLIQKGAQPDTIVGIMAKPSTEMMVGILGILKAGSAYLPIDMDYPQERIQYMLKDSNAKILLKDNDLFTFPLFSPSTLPPFPPSNPTSLAYIIYTSGSTGRPKGVMVQHRSLANACTWQISYYNIDERDHTTQYAPFVFDASILEIFPCLLQGASLYIITEEMKLDPQHLNRYYEKMDITFSFLPTQFCELFMELENHSLRVLLAAGGILRKFIKRNYRLYNNYGPTENTVVTTSQLVETQSHNIPIGTPIYNNHVYILDKSLLHLQPIGVPGELSIGGESLSRGYLNQPELTAEKFVEHMSDRSHMSYIYKTGDLARWLPDGNIEFLGRIDNQVKIRGFRIELGEIETRLMNHDAIKEAVVLEIKSGTGENYLCAYIVTVEGPAAEQARDVSVLREFLSHTLPDYMIPAHFVQVQKIPLTTNGKLDRKALISDDSGSALNLGTQYVEPGNELEKLIAETWKEILHLEKVGVNDNFFALGGNSLKVIRLNSRINQKLATNIPVAVMFERLTIRSFVDYLSPGETGKEKENHEIDRSDVLERTKPKRAERKFQRKIKRHQIEQNEPEEE